MSASKARGTAFESLVVRGLARWFPAVERRALAGTLDRGDIAGVPGWTVECKAVRAMSLGAWLDEAKVEAGNARTPFYAVVHKRRGKGAAEDQFVSMPLSVFAEWASS